MAYQTILSSKESTYGSPTCVYTVQVEPTNRTATGVTLNIKVSAHLYASSSTFGTGYTLKGTLTVAGTSIAITIKESSASWSGTTVHTVTTSKTLSNIDASTTSLTAKFSVTSSASDKACGLNATTCSSITIPVASGLVYIDNGSSFSAYEVYIDNGTSWSKYEPYIDRGTAWGKY